VADALTPGATLSFRAHILEKLTGVLEREHFPVCEVIPLGILKLIDAITAYHEEGQKLYPQVILTTDLARIFTSVPFAYRVPIRQAPLITEEFSTALQLCAPLAVGRWAIYLDIDTVENRVTSGLISAEISETSPSLYRHVFGDLSVDSLIPAIHVASIGQRTVLIKGNNAELPVSLCLKDGDVQVLSPVMALANAITLKCKVESLETTKNFIHKLLIEGLRDCHGTLVGVIDDDEKAIAGLTEALPDGTYLPEPIDLSLLIENCENEKSTEAHTRARLYSEVVKNMLNFDGITIFSNSAKILAFHCFIKDCSEGFNSSGARSRAHNAMIASSHFVQCYFRSQDGQESLRESE
jgi:hypothetical protein